MRITGYILVLCGVLFFLRVTFPDRFSHQTRLEEMHFASEDMSSDAKLHVSRVLAHVRRIWTGQVFALIIAVGFIVAGAILLDQANRSVKKKSEAP